MNKHNIDFQSFLKQQGIIFPHISGSYEPISGHYIYGPLGKKIKLQLETYIRNIFDSLDYDEIDAPLIYPKNVWINSGHWNKFTDPIIFTKTGSVARLDKEIEEQFPEIEYGKLSNTQILDLASKLKSKNIDDPYIVPTEIQYRNLMMKTYSGAIECALRPETATTTYTSFDDLYNYNKKMLPMKVYQIGKAFRNEISPRNGIIRCREFTQAEGHIFIDQNSKNVCELFEENKYQSIPIFIDGTVTIKTINDCCHENLFKSKYYAWLVYQAYKIFANVLPENNIRLRQHAENEKAFYALDAWDVEIKLDIGWTEICGVHDRGNYDLTQHKPTTKLNNIPHILELAIGVDRFLYALLDAYYDKRELSDGKTILRLPHILAPIRYAVFPLVKNNKDIVKKAQEVYKILKQKYPNTIFDEKQSIGKRYLKYGMFGVPSCVTIDHETLVDNMITIRDRDTENQIRVNINTL